MKIGGAGGAAESSCLFLLPVEERMHRAFVERDGVVVDIQLDVLLDDRGVHFLRVFGDILPARVRMRERIFDARPQGAVNRESVNRGQVAPYRDGCQRQRAIHARFPHGTQIFHESQTLRLIREAPLVNQHAAIHVTTQDCLLDLVEPHRHGLEAAEQP